MTRKQAVSQNDHKVPIDWNFIFAMLSVVVLCSVTGVLAAVTKDPMFSQAFLVLIGSFGGMAAGKKLTAP